MTTDDQDGDDPQRGADKPTRDARGRWLTGYCPNLKGRPKKKPKVFLDESDIQIFGNTLIDVVSNGQKETMIRRSALINKIFESAMKGSLSQQRFLYHEFEKNDLRLAAARVRYDRLIFDWILDNPDFSNPDFDMPLEVQAEIEGLRTMLNHYYPGQYLVGGMSANDDGDDDDDDDG